MRERIRVFAVFLVLLAGAAQADITVVGTPTTASGGATSAITLNSPSGTQADDYLYVRLSYLASATITPPASWATVISANTNSNCGSVWYYIKLTGAADSTYTWNFNVTAYSVGAMIALRGVALSSPLDASASSTTASSSPSTWPGMVMPSVTTTHQI